MTHLPEVFIERLRQQLGSDFAAFEMALQETAPVSIRLNPHKPINRFNDLPAIPWAAMGRYLNERPSFTHDPLFQAGCYYVQEASSMLLEQALQLTGLLGSPIRALDLCAAPGGKTTHLLSLLSEDSLLISNEIISNRNGILRENLVKWGQANVVVTQNEPAHFSRLGEFFDLLVVDAPCSGEGLFRKDPAAVNEWSPAAVENCATRQSSILADIIPALRPGGYLIYSTCTYEAAENDLQVKALIEEHGFSAIPFTETFGATATQYGLQCYPHQVKGEGFYIAVLLKNESDEIQSGRKQKIPPFKYTTQAALTPFLKQAYNFRYFEREQEWYAIPAHIAEIYPLLASQLYVRQAGIACGTLKGKDFIPSPQLAQSVHLKFDDHLELNEADAIRFMRCEGFTGLETSNGWKLVTFQQQALGWMKVTNGRGNNHFPKGRRILT